MRALKVSASVASWIGLAACAQSAGPGVGVPPGSSRHSSTTLGASRSTTPGSGSTGSGSTNGGGSSTTGGASSSSSGGGSSSGAACSGALLTSSLYDLFSETDGGALEPVAGAEVSAISVQGAPIGGESTLSAASGTFALCVATGQEFAPQIQASGYATAYLEDLDLQGDYSFATLELIQTETVTAFASALPGFDPSDAVIQTQMISASGQPPCNVLQDWAISATLPDGGAVAYKTAYGSLSGFPVASRKSTDSLGFGYFYNLDPNVTDAVLVTATQMDAGAYCPVNDGGPFTSRVVIGPASFSLAPLVTP